MNSSLNEPFPQQTEAHACVIIHPGSHFLRIGRPSDSAPHTILHAIACKRKKRNAIFADQFLNPLVKLDSHTIQEVEECRLKVSHILQSSLTSDGTRRFATPPQQVATFNKRCQARVDEDQAAAPPLESPTKDVVIGDDIFSLKHDADYNIHFPYRKGDLNIHQNLGGSITAVLSYLEAIWGHCITTLLNVPLKDLKFYRAVLVIPDIYNRDYVKKLTNLLLCDLGFGGCFVIQDHVAATFGAGLGAACVVDVGAQKTSISCVEDAISHPATRLRLDYGGSDVTQVLHWLLRKTGFPYYANPTHNRLDGALLNTLKHDFCHINLNICGPQEKEFYVVRPGDRPCKYRVQMGDELLIAPLSFFYPELLKITGPKSITTQQANDGDPDDPLDENFLRETTRMRGREAAESMDVNCIDSGEGGEEEIVVDEAPIHASTLTSGINSTSSRPENSISTVEKLMSIEQAILASIDKCPNDELKRKMYSSILVVGGGAKFENFGKWLQNRLNLQIPLAFRSEQLEVTTRPKDLDPAMTVWKGAALMTCLEGSGELWVLRGEWIRQGLKVLREKCPFIW